ncbi:hypothetical protein SISSUDRAFT_1058666 [Sistotremastrum suecicum HHB10207 ss-3]|uniref:GH18 domain-containing protein n=1 Tax=Sistotremastrum suecicum HHB10207 ss-3 TaxID=1314776 RepID=A0A166H3L3_9AGAM|nr:hypothetical protein SISSUDRAFT_1058666 [Sistotremastrum suecicum HHB10207 ss-3]
MVIRAHYSSEHRRRDRISLGWLDVIKQILWGLVMSTLLTGVSASAPSCNGTSSTGRTVAYYQGSAASRSCMLYTPEDIPTSSLTHINYASAYISSGFQIEAMNSGDQSLWLRTTGLKATSPELRVFLSIGGWEFNNGASQEVFSTLVRSEASTKVFIASALEILETYGFDGIDIDWQFPGATDRGGSSTDRANFVTFMGAVKSAFQNYGYGLTFTVPSSTYYLPGYDLAGLLNSADWVNILAFDLHGTWDGTDPSIGPGMMVHSNLTLIDAGLQPFWQAGVNPSQITLGLALYGRTFTLADTECFFPGCPWLSGGGAGPCSHNSGTLMFAELDATIDNPIGVASLDEDAAINFIGYNDNQWASYDDSETFGIKIDYANQHCLGGIAIWSIDQDDQNASGLQAIFPNALSTPGPTGVTVKDQCSITGCGAKSCAAGSIAVIPLYYAVPMIVFRATVHGEADRALHVARHVTPEKPSSPQIRQETATNVCQNFELLRSYGKQLNGEQDVPAAPSVRARLKVQVPSKQFFFRDLARHKHALLEKLKLSAVRLLSRMKIVPGSELHLSVLTTHAPQDKYSYVMTDPQGDSSQPCSGTANRAYCCDPAGSNFESIPLDWIWNTTEFTPGPESVTIQLDSDSVEVSDAGNGQGDAFSTWSGVDDGSPNDEPFGAIFLDSPNAASLSSMTAASDWVITSCDKTSDQAQQVLAYCSKPMDDPSSGCGHVFLGQAEHTIIKLPGSCGAGPYARISSLSVHPDQDVLSAYHTSKKPSTEPVYLLSFDYQFTEIPESNGPVYFRVDASDIPGYWDGIVNSPTSQKRDVERSELWNERHWDEKRGLWDDFKSWVSEVTTITAESSDSRTFEWSDTYTIFSQRESCPGPPAMQSSMDISVSGRAALNTRYGFYAKGSILPPEVDTAYIYFSADALARATFTIQGQASISYDSTKVKLLTIGFPGLQYPGLITVGPSLVITGYITGSLSLGGKFEVTSQYQFPQSQIVLGKSANDQIPKSIAPSFPPLSTAIPTINWEIDLNGNLALHLVPQLQLGISILEGKLIDAQAYLAADIYGGVSITGSVSSTQAASFCINPYIGVSLVAGLQGSLAYWETGALSWPLYSNQINIPANGWCWGSQSERDLMKRISNMTDFSPFPHSMLGISEVIPEIPDQPVAQIVEKVNGVSRVIYPETISSIADHGHGSSTLDKRGKVPFLPGNLFCPNTGKNVGLNNTDYDPYSDLDDVTLEDAYMRRDLPDDSLIANLTDIAESLAGPSSKLVSPVSLRTVASAVCPKIKITLPNYDSTTVLGYWDLANPGSFDNKVALYTGPVTGGKYAREHVYEAQMLTAFIDSLQSNTGLWTDSKKKVTFCSWAEEYINSPYYETKYSVAQRLGRCLPANSASGTDLTGATATQMYMLESLENGVKAQAVAKHSLRRKDAYGKYAKQKMISVARASSAVAPYINQPTVKKHFQQTHVCVNKVWLAWADEYFTDTNVDAPNKGSWGSSTSNLYSTWAQSTMNAAIAQIKSSLSDFGTWFGTSSVMVPLDFAGKLSSATAKGAGQKSISGTDVANLASSVTSVDLSGMLT